MDENQIKNAANKVFGAIFLVGLIVFTVLLLFSPDTKPKFLNEAEHAQIQEHIKASDEMKTALAKIADSRELSDEELTLIANAINELSQANAALEEIIQSKTN